jgi:PleD family two-component response regulator
MALITAADRALYSAKRDGRDRIAVARLAPRWYA